MVQASGRVDRADGLGNHQSTLGQAKLLLKAFGAMAEQKALVEAAFPAAKAAGNNG